MKVLRAKGAVILGKANMTEFANHMTKNHSIICKELLGLGVGKDSPVPELRTAEYYK